jgi:hypothetical protein
MKKIMFNDKYGLTQAVLKGRKTMTRRIVPKSVVDYYTYEAEDPTMIDAARFEIDEIVAIAQAYETLAHSGTQQLSNMMENPSRIKKEYCGAGWNNKLFVESKFMLHHIKITDIKVERLQDISNEDCLKEGILKREIRTFKTIEIKYQVPKTTIYKDTPREAFAALIDKVSGKCTWDSNPWVFVYEFELVK